MKAIFGKNASPYEDRSTQQPQQYRSINDNAESNFTPKFSPPKGFPRNQNNVDQEFDDYNGGNEGYQKARSNNALSKSRTNDEYVKAEYGSNRYGQQQVSKAISGLAGYNQSTRSIKSPTGRSNQYEEEDQEDEVAKEEEEEDENLDAGDEPQQNAWGLQNNRSFDSKAGATNQGMPNYYPFYPPQQYYNLPPGYMPFGYYPSPLQPQPHLDPNAQMANSQFADPKILADNNEILTLRAKVNELNQIIEKERDTNKKFEKKCKDYVSQLERSAKNFEEFKQRMLDDKNSHQEEIEILESRIQDLRGRLSEQEKYGERNQNDMAEIKKKLSAELAVKNKLSTELEAMKSKIQAQAKQKDGQDEAFQKQAEEFSQLKKNAEAERSELQLLKSRDEKNQSKIKELENQLGNAKNDIIQTKKQADTSQKQLNFSNNDLESLRSQNANLEKQNRSLAAECEATKNELFETKQQLISSQQKEATLKMHLEKHAREINQMQSMINRSDKSHQEQAYLIQDLQKELYRLRQQSSGREIEAPLMFDYPKNLAQMQTAAFNNPSPNHKNQRLKEYPAVNNFIPETSYEIPRADSKKNQNISSKEAITRQVPTKVTAIPNMLGNVQNIKNSKALGLRASDHMLTWDDSDEMEKPIKELKKIPENQLISKNSNVQEQQFKPRENAQDKLLVKQQPGAVTRGSKETDGNNSGSPSTAAILTKEEQIQDLEDKLLEKQRKRDEAKDELQKLDKVKIKSNATVRKKQELDREIEYLNGDISAIKNRLREFNVLHSF